MFTKLLMSIPQPADHAWKTPLFNKGKIARSDSFPELQMIYRPVNQNKPMFRELFLSQAPV